MIRLKRKNEESTLVNMQSTYACTRYVARGTIQLFLSQAGGALEPQEFPNKKICRTGYTVLSVYWWAAEWYL